MTATLRAISETINIKLKTVQRAASRGRFHTEKINGVLYADPEDARHHFATCKPGRPPKPTAGAPLWAHDKSGNVYPTRANLMLYSNGKLPAVEFARLMRFCEREPALADKILESIDEGKIWVPEFSS